MSRRKRKRIQFDRNRLRKIMRSLQRRKKKKKAVCRTQRDIVYSFDASRLLYNKKFYNKDSDRYSLIKTDGIVKVTIPKDFSIATNPDEVIYILKKIFYCGIDKRVKEIMFDHSRCTNLGIAASTIMDTVVLAAKSFRRSSGKTDGLVIAGNYPADQYTKDVFIGSGLVKHLDLHAIGYRQENESKIFKLVSGKIGTQESAAVATKLTKYFNDCLKTQKYRLTDAGENHLGRMFSEVLDNCEKHGGNNAIWYALGHYQMRAGAEYGEIQLTIFNFGATIYEQLCSSETTIETREKLDLISKAHARYFSSTWNKEMLFTVFSLQEGISRLRDPNKKGFRNRGTGTVTLMNTFYQLGQTTDGKEPELVIVSGGVHIRFDGRYKPERKVIHDKIFEGKERQIIAFNKENDIYRPAEDNISSLKEGFPGTIIAMRFYLDQKYLDSMLKEENNGK